jgi:hypothetical protein
MANNPKRCPCCGAEWPKYLVEDLYHGALGCESCLIIKKDGVIQ